MSVEGTADAVSDQQCGVSESSIAILCNAAPGDSDEAVLSVTIDTDRGLVAGARLCETQNDRPARVMNDGIEIMDKDNFDSPAGLPMSEINRLVSPKRGQPVTDVTKFFGDSLSRFGA